MNGCMFTGSKLGDLLALDWPEFLDEGTDPITGGWEDGNGNTCSLDGWWE